MSAPIYNPDRTYLVDSHGTSYMVRGNEPLQSDGTTFAYDALNDKLKDLIGGSFDLSDYTLLDVSVIDDVSERTVLEAEFATFGISNSEFNTNFPTNKWPPVANGIDVTKQYGTTVSGHPGSIIWYPVQGCTDMSNCLDIEPRLYKFIAMIDFLRNLLETNSQTVIYFHCEHGHDRTSAVHGGYMIKYMKASLNDVLTKSPPDGAKAFNHDWEVNYKQLVEYYDAHYTPVS